eukprot:Gb_28451 [translate_table: standard]
MKTQTGHLIFVGILVLMALASSCPVEGMRMVRNFEVKNFRPEPLMMKQRSIKDDFCSNGRCSPDAMDFLHAVQKRVVPTGPNPLHN